MGGVSAYLKKLGQVKILMVEFPYGKTAVRMNLPDEKLLFVVKPHEFMPRSTVKTYEIEECLHNPIGEGRLSKLTLNRDKVCIIISDYTRAVPNDKLLPPILHELKKAGCPLDNVTIIIANGLHKPASKSEIGDIIGKTVAEDMKIVNHDAENKDELFYLGKTSYGTGLWVNRIVAECSFIIATGLIEPHFFAGYSGGRKSILPGIAGEESIFQNHSFKMIAHPRARYGILAGNPIHEDMMEAMKMAKLNYIVNVVSKNGRVVKAFAGDPCKAYEEGIRFVDKLVKVHVPSRAEIVITTNGGYPLDRDLYQAVKGMAAAELVVKKGGVIIILSECIDGIGRGHESFYDLMSSAENPDQVLGRIEKEEPLKDQWEVQVLARILKFANVIVVTRNVKHSLIEDMHLIPASSLEEALSVAYKLTSKESKIIAMPYGPYVIPSLNISS
jgi:nickel-dependent lactate racemase